MIILLFKMFLNILFQDAEVHNMFKSEVHEVKYHQQDVAHLKKKGRARMSCQATGSVGAGQTTLQGDDLLQLQKSQESQKVEREAEKLYIYLLEDIYIVFRFVFIFSLSLYLIIV